MKLHELKASAGARKAVTRKGRGAGSGNGKTAGFGHKGQKARSGVKKAGFEGGQMPLQRRLPKRGFNNIFATKYVTIKVSDLEKFEAGATVDTEALLKAGIISKTLDGVKVLGNGELTKALNVKVAPVPAFWPAAPSVPCSSAPASRTSAPRACVPTTPSTSLLLPSQACAA